MGAKQAAEYYRDEAAKAVRRAAQATIHKERPAREAKHHALAADALAILSRQHTRKLLRALANEAYLTSRDHATLARLAAIGGAS